MLDVHPEARERLASWRPRSARSRSRDAERSGRCRRRECRSAARRAAAAPSPSTRCASRAGPGRSPKSQDGSPASSPSTARSRAGRPSCIRRRRRARRPACRRDRAAPAVRTAGSVAILKVDRAVAAVGVAVALEREDHVAHRAQVRLVGRARRLLRRLDAELRRVLAERADPLLRVLAQRHAGLLRAGDRLVVDVGVVDGLADVGSRTRYFSVRRRTSRQTKVGSCRCAPRA